MSNTPPLELWTWATPNGWKVSIMLEELIEAGIKLPDIDVRHVDIGNREQFSKAFTAISPNQKIPGLVDGDQTLMESCAILLYLAEKYPSPLLPQDASRWQVIQWLFWQAAGMGPTFGNKLSYTRYLADLPEEQKKHPLERFNNEAQRLLRVLNKQLEGKDYICGDNFTIADIACYPWVRGWKWSKIDITGHANVVAWVDRVRARPAVARGLEYGIPKEEVDHWKEDTKQRYANLGATIASNTSIASD
ncbi:MAG: glutathione S-transferase family protein [Candidatus Pelagadaptatus aseana]|uniref:glutathione S-transferase family protein n=1 Tax=Candidatus Pelagadaptatus aseana TaxID=3120508 RepID=UPI0039B240D6